jgi:hypothetical protein
MVVAQQAAKPLVAVNVRCAGPHIGWRDQLIAEALVVALGVVMLSLAKTRPACNRLISRF